MKHSILMSLGLLLSMNTFGQELVTEDDYASTDLDQERSIDLSVGYSMETVKASDSSDSDAKLTGVVGSAGKIFFLDSEVTTTSILSGKYSSFDDKFELNESANVNSYEFSFSQRVSYNTDMNGAILKPFVEAGIGRGALLVDYREDGVLYEMDFGYLRYGGAVGLQLTLENGVTPFVKYEVAKLKLDNEAKVKASGKGVSFEQDISLDASSRERTNDVQSLVIGLGVQF